MAAKSYVATTLRLAPDVYEQVSRLAIKERRSLNAELTVLVLQGLKYAGQAEAEEKSPRPKRRPRTTPEGE